MPSPSSLEVDLLEYGNLTEWTPQVGDVIHKDGLFFNRWVGIILSVKSHQLTIRKAGNPRLLVMGDYKDEEISSQYIKNSMVGSYYVVAQRGIYYV